MELLVSAKLAHPKFHGKTWNSMELLVTAKLANPKFHGIAWNSMEMLVSAKLAHLKFHGFTRVIEIGALLVPWNSMELLVSVPWNSMEPIVCCLLEPLISSIPWVLKWDRIPRNLSFQILMKIVFNCAGWVNFRKLMNILYLFASPFHQLHYNICISGITHYVSKYSKSLFNAHWNLFWSKSSMELSRVPWNFLNNI